MKIYTKFTSLINFSLGQFFSNTWKGYTKIIFLPPILFMTHPKISIVNNNQQKQEKTKQQCIDLNNLYSKSTNEFWQKSGRLMMCQAFIG